MSVSCRSRGFNEISGQSGGLAILQGHPTELRTRRICGPISRTVVNSQLYAAIIRTWTQPNIHNRSATQHLSGSVRGEIFDNVSSASPTLIVRVKCPFLFLLLRVSTSIIFRNSISHAFSCVHETS